MGFLCVIKKVIGCFFENKNKKMRPFVVFEKVIGCSLVGGIL